MSVAVTIKGFLDKKDVQVSAKRYGIGALSAMAQGLFASLFIGTIMGTLGEQTGIGILVTVGNFAKSATGASMAVAIGCALKSPFLVLFSLIAVGQAANSLWGSGGPLAVYFVAIIAAEAGKLVSKETKIDIIVTPMATIVVCVLVALLCAPYIGACELYRHGNHVGDGSSAFFDGNSGIGDYRYGTDAADKQRRDLRGAGANGFGRGSSPRRMLRPDGRLRRDELQGKPFRRPICAGHRHVHASNGEHSKKPANLDTSDRGGRDYRPAGNLRFPP